MLAGRLRSDRGAARRLAEPLGVSARWLRALRARAARAEEVPLPGRPRIGACERARIRARVEEQRKQQGRTAGARPILAALREQDPATSRYLVDEAVRDLKREERAQVQREHEARRVSLELQARDAVWGQDTTHLGRGAGGSKVEAEVIKDLGTLQTVGLSVGAAPTATDVVALLKQAARERGGLPLVHLSDHGSIYGATEVVELLKREQVVHLRSRVHTPQDNGATEHQHAELKGESGLGKGARLSAQEAHVRIQAARTRLDGCRRRATKGWRTAEQLGRELTRADARVNRSAFYSAACSAMDKAEQGLSTCRARLKARRDALYASLEAFGLATRHVGRRPRERPGPVACNASNTQLQCPHARAGGP